MITVSSDLSSCDIAGEAVVLDLKQGVYYGLNPVGATIWNLLMERPRTFAELASAIGAEYEIDESQCRTEVAEFLDKLKAAGLVTEQVKVQS